ncbi:MAG: sauU 3 [Gammaproteobacteria bacterium]|jgi:MFS family permease|nr:sauU 3 [Gammaproteobacteria bacterium]
MATDTNLEKQQGSPYAWLIWACGALFFFYEFCLQSSPSVMVPELMKAFNVNASQLGRLSGVYFFSYAIMQLPVGILLDRYGPRIMMTIACFICALGAYIFSHTHILSMAELARLLMGAGSACAFISALKLASLWFPANRYAFLAGLLVMFGFLGAMGGQGPLSHFVEHYGWRDSMEILSVAGFILAILFFIVVRNGPLFHAHKESAKAIENHAATGLRQVLSNWQIWLLALYAALMFSPTPAFGELWGVPFIVNTFHISSTLAASINSILFVGWIVGCPLFGYLSDRSRQRLPYIKFGCWASLVTMICVVYLGHFALWFMGVSLFLFGFFSSTFVLAFTIAKEGVTDQYAGTASGFLNMLNELAPFFLQIGIGAILDLCWNGQMQDGIRYYTAANYHLASLSLLVVIVGALIVLRFIKNPEKI